MTSDGGAAVTGKERRVLADGEQIEYASRPMSASVPSGSQTQRPLVLLTDRRFLMVRPKTFGTPTVDFEVPWRECEKVSADVDGGDMMRIRVVLRTSRGDVTVVTDPSDAYEVETRTRAAYWPYRQ